MEEIFDVDALMPGRLGIFLNLTSTCDKFPLYIASKINAFRPRRCNSFPCFVTNQYIFGCLEMDEYISRDG
jgi:hypothetical protein